MLLIINCEFMKTTILCLTIIFLTVTASAQNKSSMIFSTAQVKYQKMETIGTILTAAGGITLFTGNILYWKVYNDRNEENPATKASKFKPIIFGGIGLLAVGIPLMANGKSKLRHIEIQARVVNFGSFASANGIGLNIRF
jgi:hypothetical protein